MNRRRQLLADQRGFTMAAVMLTMMIGGLFAVGAWSAANGDIRISRGDQDRKRAYEAAEAGVQWYTYQLEKNTNYWTYCADSTKVGAGVNMQGTRTSWHTLPGSQEQFAIELMPASKSTSCTTDPNGALLGSQGLLKIRSTGVANGKQRQIYATFRRSSFLDYIYFTKWETLPPAAYTKYGQSPSWAQTNCDAQRSVRSSSCIAIQFPSGDAIKGPLHTEDDSLLICGTPTFGRTSNDKIEVARGTSSTAFKQNGSGCSGSPNVLGTLSAPAKSLDLPGDNQALNAVADYRFTGNTCIKFNGNQMTVWPNQTRWGQPAGSGYPDYRLQIACTGTSTTYTLAEDTVIWIAAGSGCTGGYDYYQMYDDPSSCGHVAVSGTYSTNVTIGAANDVIVNGDIIRTGDAMMGLVAGNFIRVYHPVNPTNRSSSVNCTTNLLSSPAVNEIDAAVLATTGSFITDNWDCGAPLGTLTVKGAITQYWRGTVGTGSSASPTSGYLKSYEYDDRLRYREPPQFLDPVTSSWNLLRESEQSPVLSG